MIEFGNGHRRRNGLSRLIPGRSPSAGLCLQHRRANASPLACEGMLLVQQRPEARRLRTHPPVFGRFDLSQPTRLVHDGSWGNSCSSKTPKRHKNRWFRSLSTNRTSQEFPQPQSARHW